MESEALMSQRFLLADLAPRVTSTPLPLPVIGAAVAVVAAALVILVIWRIAVATGRRRRRSAPEFDETSLMEDLASLPSPPELPAGGVRLSVRGVPVRVRLVVLAPLGRGGVLSKDDAVPLLDQVVRGLGELTRQDKARVRVWPTQISGAGFHPRFMRLVPRPEGINEASRWVHVAGTARLGSQQILVGLALLAKNPVNLQGLALEPDGWYDLLRIEKGK
jgi:hypothetical protein